MNYDLQVIPRHVRPLFWEIDANGFDPRSYPRYTIGRILEWGDERAYAWLKGSLLGGGNQRSHSQRTPSDTKIRELLVPGLRPASRRGCRSRRTLMEESGNWPPEAISPAAQDLLLGLGAASLSSRFYLAGGTGLALRFGHRRSVDFEFFSQEIFNEETLDRLLGLLREYSPSVLSRAPSTLHLLLLEIKASFIGYPYPLLFPTDRFSSVDVADARDIACMKLSAVASRGTRRDFVDLYVAVKEHSLGEILSLFVRKYAGIEYSRLHLLKSLSYFEDAEADPPLDMLTEISWADVKDFFARESATLL